MIKVDDIAFVGEPGRGPKTSIPWRFTNPGQSFLVPFDGKESRAYRQSLSIRAGQAWGSGNYATKIEESGVRVFRLK